MTGTLFRSNVAPTEGIPLPLALTGLRKEIEGQPCHYRRHKILSARTFTHRGDGTRHDVTRDRLAALVEAFNKRKAKGLRPFVPDRHTLEPSAKDNLGWVENLELSGDDLYADLQLIGDDALKLAARNNVSLLTTADALDADGVKYPEVVHHVALTPNEALSDLGGFIKIAASAGGSAAIEAPILEPAAPLQEHPMFKPETLKNLRAKLKLPDTTPEADVAEQAAALALKDPPADKTAEVTALSADVKRLEKERDDANSKALALSASAPRQPDPEVMRDRADNYTQRLDLMVDRGDMPKYVADKIKAVVKPTATLMLSAAPDLEQKRPIDFVLSLFDGAKLGIQSGNPVTRPATPAPLALSGEPGTPDAATAMAEARKEGEKYQQETLRSRGLQPLTA